MSKRRRGFVYIIECETGHFKIGKTSGTIQSRLSAIQTASPFTVSLFHKIECDDCNDVEKSLHEVFSNKRIRGEWFALDEWDLLRLRDYGSVTCESAIQIVQWEQYCSDAVVQAECTEEYIGYLHPEIF